MDIHPNLKAEVVAELVALGWTASGYTAIASKTYRTAVGPKEAHVYLAGENTDWDNCWLAGDYQSEGRNILSRGLLIPKNADTATVRDLIRRFAADADLLVSQSYAARLLAA